MPYNPALKVAGWTSSYRSVQKFLNHLKKDKKLNSEETANDSLFCIQYLCEVIGKNPDELIASIKSDHACSDRYCDLVEDRLRKSGLSEPDVKFWEANFVLFQLMN